MASKNRTVDTIEKPAVAVPGDPSSRVSPDTEEQIRVAAYFIYENNGCQQGHALDDWVCAQAQLGVATSSHGGTPEVTPTA
jgi:hypothetical protein